MADFLSKLFNRNNSAKTAAAAKPAVKESGFSGETYLNYPAEAEYLPELQGERGLETYDKMRRSDGTVNASLMAVKLPLLMASWRVEPASEKRADRKVAEFLEKNLFHNSKDWQLTLEEILTALDFGCSVFEPVFEKTDEGIMLSKLAFRPQRTISKWVTDANGELTGIEQTGMVGGRSQTVLIPIEQCVIFSNKKEGKNWQGVSILRTAYKAWYFKTKLETLGMISADRFALGIPIITLQEGFSEEDLKRAKETGANMRANEKAYAVLPPGADMKILTTANARADLMPDINYHKLQISENILAGFLNLGTGAGGTGSYALASELKEFFLLSLRSIAKNIEGVLNSYLVPKLLAWNYGDGIEPPVIKAEKLTNINIQQWASAMKLLVDGGLIETDDELEQFVRNVAGLPEIDLQARELKREEDAAREEEAKKQLEEDLKNQPPNPPQDQNDQNPDDGQKAASRHIHGHKHGASEDGGFSPFRELLEHEKNVDFKLIGSRLDSDSASAGKLVLMVENTMKGQILDQAAELTPETIQTLELSDPTNEGRLRKKAEGIYAFGREQVRKEIKAKSSAARKNPAKLFSIDDWVRLAAVKIANRLKTATAEAAGSMSWNRLSDEEKKSFLTQRLESLSDDVIALEGTSLINSAFSYGRFDEAAQLLDDGKIEEICTGSSIMDENLCDACRDDIDGQEFTVGSEEYYDAMPPYRDCEGGRKCRCVFVYRGIAAA